MTTRRNRLQLVRAALGSALVGLAAGGCGNVTVGGYTEVNVSMTGDAPTPAPVSALAAAAPLRVENEPSGQVELAFRLRLVSATGDTVALGGDELEASIDVQGQTESEVVQELIPAGRYAELQIVFKEVSVEVEGGLVVDSMQITGPVDVEIEGLSLVVSRALAVDAQDGATIRLVVDLNAPAWLEAVDPDTRTINENVFADLVDVVVE